MCWQPLEGLKQDSYPTSFMFLKVTLPAFLEFIHPSFNPFMTKFTAHLLCASHARHWRFRVEYDIILPSWSSSTNEKRNRDVLKAGWQVPWYSCVQSLTGDESPGARDWEQEKLLARAVVLPIEYPQTPLEGLFKTNCYCKYSTYPAAQILIH